MARLIPIALGQKFGRLTVVGPATSTSPKNPRWECRCDCGKTTRPHAGDLRRKTKPTRSCGCLAIKDMTNLRFGRLTVIGQTESTSSQARWKCQCDCGNITQVEGGGLRRGTTRSCGCWLKDIMRERFSKDLAGQRFGRLVVLHRAGKSRHGQTLWRCRCDCGRETKVMTGNLGRTKACGCLHRECAAQLNYRHGGTHGGKASPLYSCWLRIKSRCLNHKDKVFKNYGGRGISIAPEWIDDFSAFRNYVDQNLGPKPKGDYSLDRIENYEGYFPGNLRWATRTEQAHNSRRSKIDKIFNTIIREHANKPTKRRRRVV